MSEQEDRDRLDRPTDSGPGDRIWALQKEVTRLTQEIADAREACPSVRQQCNFDAPLLTLVNLEVSRGFNRDAELDRVAQENDRLKWQGAETKLCLCGTDPRDIDCISRPVGGLAPGYVCRLDLKEAEAVTAERDRLRQENERLKAAKWFVIVHARSWTKCYGMFTTHDDAQEWLQRNQFDSEDSDIYPIAAASA